MKLAIDFEITYSILYQQSELYVAKRSDKIKNKFKKHVLKDEVKLGKMIGMNKIKLVGINHKQFRLKDCVVLASYVCKFRDELPFNCSRLANVFIEEFLGIGDNNDD